MKLRTCLALGLLFMAAMVNAQTANTAIYATLEYYDNPAQIKITDAKGFSEQSIYFGFKLNPGDTIATLNSKAEIRLVPSNSIIKLGPNTQIAVNALQGLDGATSNDLNVVNGKVRMVASKLGSPSYTLRTPTAVAGVRGTDFALEVSPGASERLVVRNGAVEFSRKDGSGRALVGAGQALDAFASTFASVALSLEELGSYFADLEFEVLDPLEVPEEDLTQTTAQTDEGTTEGEDEADEDNNVVVNTATTDAPVDEPAEGPPAETPEWQKALAEFIGLELGSVTMDDGTYGKAVLQPRFEGENYVLALYLPVVYRDNLFDPKDWYRPKGNDEWSFGTDQGDDWVAIARDAAQDLILKIRYLELGKERSGFHLKLANIPAMSLGHGILVDRYANDVDFPAVRRVGLNLAMDSGKNAFEFLVDDLADPSLVGTRFLLRPAPDVLKAGMGFSVAADLFPMAVVSNPVPGSNLERAKNLDPALVWAGIDLDVPIIETGILGIIAFADAGTVMPIVRNAGNGLKAGAQWQSLGEFETLSLKNYGWMTGVMGNVLFLDYRLALQYSQGAFEVGMVDKTFDRTRATKASLVVDSLVDSSFSYGANMAVEGEASADILGLVDIGLSYRWPWASGGAAPSLSNPDTFVASILTKKDALPYGLEAGITYQRSHFKDLFTPGSTYTWLDEYTSLSGLGVIPVGDFFKLRAKLGTAIKRDTQGDIVLDAQGKPTMYPVLTIETVIGQ